MVVEHAPAGAAAPAVPLPRTRPQHDRGGGAQPQLDHAWCRMMLSAADCAVAVCDARGRVLRQNAASLAYAGERTKGYLSAASPAGEHGN